MKLTLLIQDGCRTCIRVKNQIDQAIKNNRNVNLKVKDVNKVNSKNLFIVPALFIEDELYNYGDINIEG